MNGDITLVRSEMAVILLLNNMGDTTGRSPGQSDRMSAVRPSKREEITMLNLWGPTDPNRFCDGLSRRSFLTIGGLAMGGLK